MRGYWPAVVTTALVLVAGGGIYVAHQVMAQENPSEKAVRKVVADWTDAFNRHDTRTIASLFAENATFVNIYGELSRGRSEIEASRESLHKDHFEEIPDTTMTTTVLELTFLKADVAVAVVKWTLSSPALGSLSTLATMVLSDTGSGWTIVSYHNTPVRPPEWRQEAH